MDKQRHIQEVKKLPVFTRPISTELAVALRQSDEIQLVLVEYEDGDITLGVDVPGTSILTIAASVDKTRMQPPASPEVRLTVYGITLPFATQLHVLNKLTSSDKFPLEEHLDIALDYLVRVHQEVHGYETASG